MPTALCVWLCFLAAAVRPAQGATFTKLDVLGAGTGLGQGTFAGSINAAGTITGTAVAGKVEP